MTHRPLRSTSLLLLAGAALAATAAFAGPEPDRPATGPLALVTNLTETTRARQRAVETPGMAGIMAESDAKMEGPLALVTGLTETTRARQRAVGTPGIMAESDAKMEGPLALVTGLTETTRARQRAVETPGLSGFQQ